MNTRNPLTVKQLNFYVRSLIEGDAKLNNVTVCGELSNFKNHYSSGHLYFSLKDNDALIRCVMFRMNASRLNFTPSDGMQVIISGKVSLYEKDGQYQFYAEEMYEAGIGDLSLKFELIKQKLEAEGLFSPDTKRKIPKFPKNIAVVTSSTGAAVQDILNILTRRWNLSNVIMCPVSVQGALAVPQIIDTLDRLYELSVADLIIIGRGGGSTEDLWAFNDEQLARKIYESPVPVISAVGHETDFTICDFVSDLRAPTPSAAAELAVPDKSAVLDIVGRYENYIKNSLNSNFNLSKARLERCISSPFFKEPVNALINRNFENIDRFYDKLNNLLSKCIKDGEMCLIKLASALDALSPVKTMLRGYAAVSLDGKNVTSVDALNKEDIISLSLSDGNVACEVKDIKKTDYLK